MIETQHLTKHYGTTVAVDGVSFDVQPGRVTGFVGPLRSVGALLDARAIVGGPSAANHLKWLVDSNGIDRRRVDEVLDLVGLSDVAGKRVGTFSLGMNQRLGIAAALLGDPETVILDEPVNGLDPDGILWIRNLMKSLGPKAARCSSQAIS
jgi:ABC-2 type transport system ATP-binding protein